MQTSLGTLSLPRAWHGGSAAPRTDARTLAAHLPLLMGLVIVACGGTNGHASPKDGAFPSSSQDAPDADDDTIDTRGETTVTPPFIDFGWVDVGAVSTALTVTVTVTGGPKALNPDVSGAGFAIVSTTCAATQDPGTCTVSVQFTPTARWAATGVLNLGDVTVALSGSGNGGSFVAAPPTIDLGRLLLGDSVPVDVPVTVEQLPAELPCLADGPDLTPTGQTCPASGTITLPCTLTFTFKAATPGTKHENVICYGRKTVFVATVTATVVTPPSLVIAPSTGIFNGSSDKVTFTVANTGGSATNDLTVAIEGDLADFAILSTDCAAPLEPLALCTVVVVFQPTLPGANAATLTVADRIVTSVSATAPLAELSEQ